MLVVHTRGDHEHLMMMQMQVVLPLIHIHIQWNFDNPTVLGEMNACQIREFAKYRIFIVCNDGHVSECGRIVEDAGWHT